jgi:hypothetical protein
MPVIWHEGSVHMAVLPEMMAFAAVYWIDWLRIRFISGLHGRYRTAAARQRLGFIPMVDNQYE